MNSSGVEILNELYGKLDESIFGPEYFMSYYVEGMYHRFSSLCNKFLKNIDDTLLKTSVSAHRFIITDNFNRGYIRNLDATEGDDVSIRLGRKEFRSIGDGFRFVRVVCLCKEEPSFYNCIQLQETASALSKAYGTEITISPTDVMEFLPGDTVIEVEVVGNFDIRWASYYIYTETYDSYRNYKRETNKFDDELIAKQLETIRFFERVYQEKKNFHKLPLLLPNNDDF